MCTAFRWEKHQANEANEEGRGTSCPSQANQGFVAVVATHLWVSGLWKFSMRRQVPLLPIIGTLEIRSIDLSFKITVILTGQQCYIRNKKQVSNPAWDQI